MNWLLHLVLRSYLISTRMRASILLFFFLFYLLFSVASFLIVVDLLVEWRLSSCEAVIKVFVIFIIIIIYMKGGRYQRWVPVCDRLDMTRTELLLRDL